MTRGEHALPPLSPRVCGSPLPAAVLGSSTRDSEGVARYLGPGLERQPMPGRDSSDAVGVPVKGFGPQVHALTFACSLFVRAGLAGSGARCGGDLPGCALQRDP
jgi:hypothetical protein